MRVTVFNEYLHEVEAESVRSVYPDGIHAVHASAVREHVPGAEVRAATLREPDHGLSQDVVDSTDVLLWWGHKAHAEVSDEVAERVQRAVLAGMGLVVLHSGHYSKPFVRLMGTHGSLKWREADEKERLWNLQPGHPVLEGVPEHFELEREEMYGERFDVPDPDELLMISWFQGGEVFRGARQHGHRPSALTRATLMRLRMVAIELGMWRSGRIGSASGSVTTGKRRFRELPGATAC